MNLLMKLREIEGLVRTVNHSSPEDGLRLGRIEEELRFLREQCEWTTLVWPQVSVRRLRDGSYEAFVDVCGRTARTHEQATHNLKAELEAGQ